MKFLRNVSKKKYLALFCILCILFSVGLFSVIVTVPNQTISPVAYSESIPVQTIQNPNPESISGLPVRISIPKIHVDAPIEYVGLTKGGAVDAPLGPDNVAWFNQSPLPGFVGNTIIDGHSGWRNNIPAVFDNLHILTQGDYVYIENDAGIILTFEVKKIKTYGKDDEALDVFNSSDNLSHLNLITCTGPWNIIENGRDDRIVIFTDLLVY